MVKVSKAGKQRIKRMIQSERKAIEKAARLLADAELITWQRYLSITRMCGFGELRR